MEHSFIVPAEEAAKNWVTHVGKRICRFEAHRSLVSLFRLGPAPLAALGGQSNTALGFAVMIPNLLGLIAMTLVSCHSDRTRERRHHMAAASALAGVGMLLLGVHHSPLFSLVLFSVVAIGAYSFLPILFSVPGEFLTGFSAAAGIALVTSVANLGGFVGPYTVGLIRQTTGSFYSGLICAGFSFLISACLSLLLPRRTMLSSEHASAAAGAAFKKGSQTVPEES